MSNHPTPGQPHPDQPSDPWQEAPLWGGQTGTAPYGEPSGYIGEQYSPAPVGYPPPGQPSVPGQPQPWQAPQPASSGGLSTMAIALITALVVVVLGGGVLGVYYYSKRGGTTNAQSTNTPTPTSSGQSTVSATSSGNPTTGPTEQDFKTARVGQCLLNRGTGDKPDMHISDCVPGTYRVLARFDGTTDESKCDGVPGLTARFHYGLGDTKLVYCLRKLN